MTKRQPPVRPKIRLLRLLSIGLVALVSLLTAMWAGLERIGAVATTTSLSLVHGPLMVLGFLGTVIALERAVGLGRWWGWIAPMTAAAGAMALIAGWVIATSAMLAAAVTLLAIYGAAMRIAGVQPHLVVMGLGAVCWVIATLGLMAGMSVPSLVPAMTAFLVLTIIGERLELSRLTPHYRGWSISVIIGFAIVIVAAAIVSAADLAFGSKLAGMSFVGMAIVSANGDVARRTIFTTGVTRYMAAALLAGYVWLAIGGLVWWIQGLSPGRAAYDVALHAIFIGFVLSMILAHVPVIVPAVAQIDLPYRSIWWSALGLLHASLIVRVIGVAVRWPTVRIWGAEGNVVAIISIIAMAAGSAIGARAHAAKRRELQ